MRFRKPLTAAPGRRLDRCAVSAVFALLGLAMWAAPASAAPPEHREVFAGSVRVGNDGNGAFAATFDAPAPGLRYTLVVDNGCRADDPGGSQPCPAPVNEISVSLNEQVVFERDDDFAHATTRLSGPISAEDNHILGTVRGSPGSAAHIRILATPKPKARKLLARSVRVGNDGNGTVRARFDAPTTPDPTYLLVVDNGCQNCPPPVSALTITLNEQVVFERDGNLTHHTTRLSSLNPQDNTILISAGGSPASGARIRIIATPASEPKPKPKPKPTHREVFADSVPVGNDGNGALAATFDAPALGLRYLLVVENGCRTDDPGEGTPCPAGVNELTITLNDDVVLERGDDFAHATTRLSGPISAENNQIVITVRGAPASAARIRILATPKVTPGPKPRPKGRKDVFAGGVRVGNDGNGVFQATFDAPAPGLRYLLVVDNGCRADDPGNDTPCPDAVREITITLNGDVVFERDDDFAHATTRLSDPFETEGNHVVITARGTPGSAAHIRIIATRE